MALLKIVSVILLFSYPAAAIGYVVSHHYCTIHKAHFASLFGNAAEKCSHKHCSHKQSDEFECCHYCDNSPAAAIDDNVAHSFTYHAHSGEHFTTVEDNCCVDYSTVASLGAQFFAANPDVQIRPICVFIDFIPKKANDFENSELNAKYEYFSDNGSQRLLLIEYIFYHHAKIDFSDPDFNKS